MNAVIPGIGNIDGTIRCHSNAPWFVKRGGRSRWIWIVQVVSRSGAPLVNKSATCVKMKNSIVARICCVECPIRRKGYRARGIHWWIYYRRVNYFVRRDSNCLSLVWVNLCCLLNGWWGTVFPYFFGNVLFDIHAHGGRRLPGSQRKIRVTGSCRISCVIPIEPDINNPCANIGIQNSRADAGEVL